MRRLLPFCLAVVATVSLLAGCGTTDDGNDEAGDGVGPSTTAAGADDGGDGGDGGGDTTTTTEPASTTTSTTEPEADLGDSTVTEEPTEPWPDPELPPEPSAQADFTEQIKYEVATTIIEAGGRAADDTAATCDPEPIPTDVAEPAATCEVTYLGVDTSAAVAITSPGDTFISYEVTVEEAPLTIEKAEWEAAYYAGGDKAVCDMDEVEAFPVNEDGIFTCDALDSTGEVIEIKAELTSIGSLLYTRN